MTDNTQPSQSHGASGYQPSGVIDTSGKGLDKDDRIRFDDHVFFDDDASVRFDDNVFFDSDRAPLVPQLSGNENYNAGRAQIVFADGSSWSDAEMLQRFLAQPTSEAA